MREPIKGQIDMFGNVIEGDKKPPFTNLHTLLLKCNPIKMVQIYVNNEFTLCGMPADIIKVLSVGYMEDRKVVDIIEKEIILKIYARDTK